MRAAGIARRSTWIFAGPPRFAITPTRFAPSLAIVPKQTPAGLEGAIVLEVDQAEAKVAGTVSGSPIVAGNLFFACEHPLADNRVVDGRAECAARYRGGAESAEAWSRSAVVGVAPPGQLRRAFLYYVERERARPYRLFLHYNSWWDIAWPDRRMDEAKCLEVMEHFGREMYQKRGVPLDSFVFDDGWDDPKTLWKFHDGFPNGFAPHQKAAEKQKSAIGVWLSPWGGYGQAKTDRLEYGKTQGFETNSRGFSLAGPTYYARYADSCKEMISKYGANYFKFDGIGQGLGLAGGGQRIWCRRGSPAQAHRRVARATARHLPEHHDGHVALALLALVRRLGLAKRRRPGLSWGGLDAGAVDHLPRYVRAADDRRSGAALSAQFVDDCEPLPGGVGRGGQDGGRRGRPARRDPHGLCRRDATCWNST